eukprot:434509-Alexandrium_andersonii.AAC.1
MLSSPKAPSLYHVGFVLALVYDVGALTASSLHPRARPGLLCGAGLSCQRPAGAAATAVAELVVL